MDRQERIQEIITKYNIDFDDAAELEMITDDHYCPECGSCGTGCCSPHRCKYLDAHQGDYDSLIEDNEALRKFVDTLRGKKLLLEWYEKDKPTSYETMDSFEDAKKFMQTKFPSCIFEEMNYHNNVVFHFYLDNKFIGVLHE